MHSRAPARAPGLGAVAVVVGYPLDLVDSCHRHTFDDLVSRRACYLGRPSPPVVTPPSTLAPAPIVTKPDASDVRDELVRTDIDPQAPSSIARRMFGGS